MKVFVFLAPLVVLAAIVLVSCWVGIRIGRVREARLRQGIDPKWADAVERFVRECLFRPADLADMDRMVIMPDKLRAQAQQLLYTAPGAQERRERLRRSS